MCEHPEDSPSQLSRFWVGICLVATQRLSGLISTTPAVVHKAIAIDSAVGMAYLQCISAMSTVTVSSSDLH